MKLSSKVVSMILESGFYFEDDFDVIKQEIVLTEESREWFKNKLHIQNINSSFIDFYSFSIGGNSDKGEELYSLEQIIEDYNSEYWLERCKLKSKYPNISREYLQFTSIEGEGSYFYGTETDYVFNVAWGQEENMILGILEPWFLSFHDFLEWYYTE